MSEEEFFAACEAASDGYPLDSKDRAKLREILAFRLGDEERRLLREWYEREHGRPGCRACGHFLREAILPVASPPCHRCGWVRAATIGYAIATRPDRGNGTGPWPEHRRARNDGVRSGEARRESVDAMARAVIEAGCTDAGPDAVFKAARRCSAIDTSKIVPGDKGRTKGSCAWIAGSHKGKRVKLDTLIKRVGELLAELPP
jgi:hypothetical protein